MTTHHQRIEFHSEYIDFELSNADKVKDWIFENIKKEKRKLKRLTYIFCSDEYLYTINVKHLQHDTYTDIITFPYSYEPVEAELYLSVDRIKENAARNKVSFEQELLRVIIHGVLHLIGFDDKSEEKKKEMRAREAKALKEFEKSYS